MRKTYELRIELSVMLAPAQFYGEGGHAQATEVDCARQVADYIHKNGMRMFLSDWNVDDFDIHVGKYPAVLNGRPVVGVAVSNQETERP